MKKLSIKIIDPIGIHARPASAIVSVASKFESSVSFVMDGKTANAKSIINLMALGAKKDSEIEIFVEGKDEEEALAQIKEVLKKEKLA